MKKSAVNGHLFLRDLRRSWPVWGGMSFAYVVFYIARFISEYTSQVTLLGREFLSLMHMSLMETALFAAVADFLLVLAVFGFVNNTKSANFFFSLPMRRDNLFLTKLAACLTATFVPAIIAGLIPVLVSGGLQTAWYLMLQLILCHCLFLGMALLCMSLLGQSVAYAAIAFIMQFVGLMFISFGYEFLRMSLYGFLRYRHNNSIFEKLLYPLEHFMSTDGRGEWGAASFILAGAGILFGILAFIAFKKRRAESAGDIVAFKFLQPVFKYGVAACAAMFFTQILMGTFNIHVITFKNLFSVCVLIAISTAIGYFIAEMLIQKKFNVFKQSFGGFAIAAAVLVGVMCFVKFDVIGLEKRVPNAEDVEWVYAAGASYSGQNGIENAISLHKFLIDQKDLSENPFPSDKKGAVMQTPMGAIAPLDMWDGPYHWYVDRYVDYDETLHDEYMAVRKYAETRYPFNVQVHYVLKNGKTLIRNYVTREVLKDDALMAELGGLYSALTRTYAYARSNFSVEVEYESGWLSALVTNIANEADNVSIGLEGDKADRLYEAVRADMINLHIGLDEVAPPTPERADTLMEDSITFMLEYEDDWWYNPHPYFASDFPQSVEYRKSTLFTVRLDTRAANTLALLGEWGIAVK